MTDPGLHHLNVPKGTVRIGQPFIAFMRWAQKQGWEYDVDWGLIHGHEIFDDDDIWWFKDPEMAMLFKLTYL